MSKHFADNNDDDPDDDKEPRMMPQPEPDFSREIPPELDRFNVPTPTVGQLLSMFPDAIPKNHPELRKRHLAAVPDLDSDLATDPGEVLDDDLDTIDPLVAAALRWRATLLFWSRPALYTLAVFIVAVAAFTAAGPVIGVAWCLYGAGWIAHAVWNTYGRPSLTQLALNHRNQ